MIYNVYFNGKKYETAGRDFEHAALCFAEEYDMNTQKIFLDCDDSHIVEVEDKNHVRKIFAVDGWLAPCYYAIEK